jgi:hypothetical protein
MPQVGNMLSIFNFEKSSPKYLCIEKTHQLFQKEKKKRFKEDVPFCVPCNLGDGLLLCGALPSSAKNVCANNSPANRKYLRHFEANLPSGYQLFGVQIVQFLMCFL